MSEARQRLERLVARLAAAGADISPPDPALAADTLDALVVRPPDEIRDLYQLADGLDLGRVEVFTLEELADVNTQPVLRRGLRAPLFFASDGGDGFFFLDTTASLVERNQVVWANRGLPYPDFAVPCGADLAGFLERASAGEEPWLADTFEERWVAAVGAFLDRTDRYQARPPSTVEEFMAARQRCGVRFPALLSALLERTDGLAIPPAGVELHGVAAVAPVEETRDDDGRPGALWIGQRAATGERFAMSLLGWRGLGAGVVVAVAPGVAPTDGVLLGPLPQALDRWEKAGPP